MIRRRTKVLAGAGILAVVLAVPFIKVNRFKEPLRRALETSLRRQVTISGDSDVYVQLLPSPGFTIGKVTVADDPAFGVEPIAYVDELRARVRIWSLLRRRISFSTLRLSEPQVNLVRDEQGRWNLDSLLRQTDGRADLPTLQVRDGRLNFRFGPRKSPLYLMNTELDIVARAAEEPVRFDFRGQPARTDRSDHGFGLFSGKGQWQPRAREESALEADVQLEKSSIAELVTLAQGTGYGLQGFVAARAHLAGPLSSIGIAGQLQGEDLSRWALLPSRAGALRTTFNGKLNLHEQQLEVYSPAEDRHTAPVSLQVRGLQLFSQPRWATAVRLLEQPIATLLPIARHLGVELPEDLTVDGTLTGVLGYANTGGWQGRFALERLAGKWGSSPALGVEKATVAVTGNTISLDPAFIRVGALESVQASGAYEMSRRELTAHVTTGGVAMATLALLPVNWQPLSRQPFQQGKISGDVSLRSVPEQPSQWSGQLALTDGVAPIPGLAEPLLADTAAFALNGLDPPLVRWQGKVGALSVEGDAQASVDGPTVLHLSMAWATLPELERLLLPSMQRGGNFLNRAFRRGRTPLPEWLQSRRVEGTLRIGRLQAGEQVWENVQSRLHWTGARLDLDNLRARWQEAGLTGWLSVDVAGNQPVYQLRARLKNGAWKGGALDGEALVETAGTGLAAVASLHSSGCFEGRSLNLLTAPVRTVSGCYEYALRRGAPSVRFDSLQVAYGPDLFYGQGAADGDSRVRFDLSSGPKQWTVTGTLLPFQLDPGTVAEAR